jgi:hypothetical protein
MRTARTLRQITLEPLGAWCKPGVPKPPTGDLFAQRLLRRCPLAQTICYRLSEDDDQLHEVSRSQMVAERSRGNNRVIEHHEQGARSITGLGQQHRMPPQPCRSFLDRKIVDDLTRPAELRRWGHASQRRSQWCANRRWDNRRAGQQCFTFRAGGSCTWISLPSPSAAKCYRPVAGLTDYRWRSSLVCVQ